VVRAYLDFASTAPPRPEAVAAFTAALETTADPGRVHSEGRAARVALEQAREAVAAMLGARPREVVFTSGATEAINAACFGAAQRHAGAFVAANIEHSAVREASARHGNVIGVAVDGEGRIDVVAVRAALDRAGTDGVAMVHCQYGNHEVGTLQPVAEIVALCRERGVLVHVDAASAVGQVAIDFDGLGADLLSFSGHKFGAMAGSGGLLVRRGLRLDPFIVGGEQERARRGGLENVPALVALGAVASALTPDALEREWTASRKRTDALLRGALAVEDVVAYGDTTERLPHIVCVGVEGVEAEAVLLGLDQAGVAAHSGSACSSESLEPSPVLEAMGVEAERSLRLSTGWSTREENVDRFVDVFPGVVERLRALGATS
jgi:cysteine desulfurase